MKPASPVTDLPRFVESDPKPATSDGAAYRAQLIRERRLVPQPAEPGYSPRRGTP